MEVYTPGSISQSLDFDLDYGGIVIEAFEQIGIPPDQVNGTKLVSARKSMNLMASAWENIGAHLFSIDKQVVNLSAAVDTIPAADGTIEVMDTYVTQSGGMDLIISPISRQDYAAIPNKAQQARPTVFWYERTVPRSQIHIWAVPPDGTWRLTYWRMRQLWDAGNLGQTSGMPKRFLEAVCTGLAQRLAVKYAPDRFQLLGPIAKEALDRAIAEDREQPPWRIKPDLSEYVIR